MREALRSLAAKGVLDVRTGSGATVARVGASRASEAVRLYVQGSRVDRGDGAAVVTYAQINDVRAMIETKVAHIAAERATEESLNKIAELHRQLSASGSEPELTARLDVAFHRALAESTGNTLFVLMLDSIEPTLLDIRRATLGVPGRFQRAVDSHGVILERLRDHDPVGAAQAMADHLQDSMRVWQELEVAERSET